MKAQQKKTSGCASNLLAHEDLGHLRNLVVGIYKTSSIMKYIRTSYMKNESKGDSLYEQHGATLKHKCGIRIVALPLFILFYFILLAFLFFGDNALLMMIITLLFIYNSRITTRYLEQDMTLYECLRRCTGICNESRATCMKEL